ncbi:hypothetical protein EIP86_001016 [Pleurotus ostreatoroseus]|nr:hypothetical protein EIP86_001016 [Pleurotus ostreatoroseus]
MSYQPSEQLLHDRVNLSRLLRRLEKTVVSQEWEEETRQPTRATWIKTKGLLQYARKLLQNVEQNDFDASPSSAQRYHDLSTTIDKLEHQLQDTETRVTPKTVRPPPILPTIPLPLPSARGVVPQPVEQPQPRVGCSPSDDATGIPTIPTQDLLLSPSETIEPILPAPKSADSLLPPSIPTLPKEEPSAAAAAPAFLQNSAALQEEMAEQLARMATQLKRNAIHFADSLEKDKAVVQDAQEKMERNYDGMTKERVRLRDHRSKSWGTTGIVILSLIVAVIGFFMTFFVIRMT